MISEQVFKKIAKEYKNFICIEVFHQCGEQTGIYGDGYIRITTPVKITWLTVTILLHELGHALLDDEWQNFLIGVAIMTGRYRRKSKLRRTVEGDATALAGALAIHYKVYNEVYNSLQKVDIGV
jgi:hypothetical protein